MVRSAVVVALSHRTVQAGAGLIAAYLAVGDERAGTTLPGDSSFGFNTAATNTGLVAVAGAAGEFGTYTKSFNFGEIYQALRFVMTCLMRVYSSNP